MAKRILLLTFCILVNIINLKAQDENKELNMYKNIFSCLDSIRKTDQKGIVTDTINISLKILDTSHPLTFFQKAGELLQDRKFNDASLVYSIGLMRYRYYNSANPDYKPSEDGALLGSLHYIIGEPMEIFLKGNIDNYIAILKICKKWLTDNDYKFFSKNKDLKKYNLQLAQLDSKIKDLLLNKAKYKKDWMKKEQEVRKMLQPTEKH